MQKAIFLSQGLMFFLFCISVFYSYTSKAQLPDLRFRHITTEQGLSDNFVNCISQDYKGYIWIGTREGLNRFDGYSIKSFKKILNNPNSISDNNVLEILNDSNDLWLGTFFGISKYKIDTDSFKTYIPAPDQLLFSTANNICGLEKDSKGNLFAVSEQGLLFKYSVSLDSFVKEKYEFDAIKDFIITKDDKFWFGGRRGMFFLDYKSGKSYRFNAFKENGREYSLEEISTIFLDGDSLWIGTTRGGIYKMCTRNFSFSVAKEIKHNFNYIHDIIKSKSGLVYISTTEGLFLFDKKTHQYTLYQHDKNNKYGLNAIGIQNSYIDKQNNLWVGCAQGGINLATNGKKFRNFNLFSKPVSLDISNISSIYQTKDRKLWVGSYNMGINVIDLKTGAKTMYKNVPGDKSTLPYSSVYSIFQDSRSDIWIGTYLSHLQKLNTATGRLSSFPYYPEKPGSIEGSDVRSIVEDKNGNLWIIAQGYGMSCFNPVTQKHKIFRRDYKNITNTLPDDWCFQALFDKEGFLWIASPSGLSRFDTKNEKFTNFYHNEKDSNSLCNNYINTIFFDSQNNLWIGTGTGLDLYDRIKNRFTHFFEKDGLPSNQIKAILEYKPGELWISSGLGLTRLRYSIKNDSVKAEFRNFNLSDNLQDVYFWERSAFKLNDGQLAFGGENGFVIFNPDEIKENTEIPNVYISDFKLFNLSTKSQQNNAEIKKSTINTGTILLNYNQNSFILEFTTINFISFEKNQFTYKLEGFDNEWVNSGNKREASYTNLDPGEYIFKVKAANNDGVWNETGAQIKIIISPPFWKTWWFRTIMVLIIGGLLFGAALYRMERLQNKNELLEQRVAQRTAELSKLNIELTEKTHWILAQNEEIMSQNQEIFNKNEEIVTQKDLIEEQKNKVEAAYEELSLYRNKLEELVEERTHELILAKEKAEESDKLKSSFLANLSHEIRTPLNSIIGFTGLLFDETIIEEERQTFKSIIDSSSTSLLNLINDIIDFSKIESGHFELSPNNFLISKVLKEVENTFKFEIKKKFIEEKPNLDFRINIDESVHKLILYADETRLIQIISNLLNNAVKFTNSGRIELGCILDENNLFLKFYVKDTGIGLKPENFQIIFERFRKVEDDNTKLYRGAGLGLTISKYLVNLLGGNIWVESELGKGSTFYFTVPIDCSNTMKNTNMENSQTLIIPKLSKELILVAEDDPSNYMYISKLLQKTEATVLHATTGNEVLNLLNTNPGITMVLMDIKMPDMNGIEAFLEIRKLGHTMPVIAQTAYALADEVRKLTEVGFSDYISKPIKPNDLFMLLEKHFQNRSK